jgi:hypothetical protein
MQTVLSFHKTGDNKASFIPISSARGCRQTLIPISPGERFRTLEGHLSILGTKEKYRSVIECQDLYPPALENLWPGACLTIACITPLLTPSISEGSRLQLSRIPVSGSILLHTKDGEFIPLDDPLKESPREIMIPLDQGPGHVSYRPVLDMMLVNYTTKMHEWDRSLSWQLELEEI